jgi:hypothetical protein
VVLMSINVEIAQRYTEGSSDCLLLFALPAPYTGYNRDMRFWFMFQHVMLAFFLSA